ncbi:MAG: helix-turn-helix transcriptional regulator [Clostridia bacterium]|nr:helix-turn-helix transcriptional regulator [Clostridia bacterium]
MKQRTDANGKNLIGERLKLLRQRDGLSQRDLASKLQLIGIDMDKNVITRIETDKRYVTDFELQALKEIFKVSYDYLIDGIDS